MEEKLLKVVESGELRCARCGLLIPFVFMKGPTYTCPSFTVEDAKPVCYHCFHKSDHSKSKKKVV